MFYYSVFYVISNIYDSSPLGINGHIKVYTDEAKSDLLTEIPFNELGISMKPLSDFTFNSKEELVSQIEDLAFSKIADEKIQSKLAEVKMVKDLGII